MRWKDIPAALRFYALGDIRFGFFSSNPGWVFVMRCVSRSDVLCRYLECDQLSAVNWLLEWIVLSLEGVEFHQMVKENAPTQTEMMTGFAKSSRGRMSSSDR